MAASACTSRAAASRRIRARFASLVQHFPLAQGPGKYVIEGISPVLDLVEAVDQDVLGNSESSQGPVETTFFSQPTSIRAEGFGFDDDQINVRISPSVASRTGAEQDHLLWIRCIDNRTDHLIDQCIRNFGHARHGTCDSARFSAYSAKEEEHSRSQAPAIVANRKFVRDGLSAALMNPPLFGSTVAAPQ